MIPALDYEKPLQKGNLFAVLLCRSLDTLDTPPALAEPISYYLPQSRLGSSNFALFVGVAIQCYRRNSCRSDVAYFATELAISLRKGACFRQKGKISI
jgi:hypothetical protein